MIPATQLRPGNVIKYEGELFSVFGVSHRTPGNKRGFVQAKLRNLRSGSMIRNRTKPRADLWPGYAGTRRLTFGPYLDRRDTTSVSS